MEENRTVPTEGEFFSVAAKYPRRILTCSHPKVERSSANQCLVCGEIPVFDKEGK